MNLKFSKTCLAVLMATCSSITFSQVTTSDLQGKVTDSSDFPIAGAPISIVHVPSGTIYKAETNENGRFTASNIRSGGPYTITVNDARYPEKVITNVFLNLGEGLDLDVKLGEETIALKELVTTGSKYRFIDGKKTGTTTNVSRDMIDKTPTISRSLNDLTKFTPQSNGNSFAGASSRFNNYTIDGNIYNNNFGLGSGQFAGGNPLSLDAIEEVQVNIAPYDVRQSTFTGASVNAITKSGTNKFKGSAYYYLQNDQMIGDKIGKERLNKGDSKKTIKGITFGGPIIKNKLFFFGSYEVEDKDVPSTQQLAARDGLVPDGRLISRVPAKRLDYIRQKMKELYGYETGAYERYPFADQQKRLNLRLDWNINDQHKFFIRYNKYSSSNDLTINGSSVRAVTRLRGTNRYGIESMHFANANYTNQKNIESVAAELNSRFGNNIFNKLNVGYTSVTDPERGIPGGQAFPFIEVLEGGLYYTALGNELYSVGNLLKNNTFNITNNLTYVLGDHKLLAGLNFEAMSFENAFNPVFNGFYRFNSYDAFERAVINQEVGAYPDAFAKGYALDGTNNLPIDKTKFRQFGVYFQDEYQVNSNLKLTGGIRFDLPSYPVDIPKNKLLEAKNYTFQKLDGTNFTPDVSVFPKTRVLISPRIGFNWNVNGEKKTQVRGGTGIFTGRIPFVWLSNQVSNSGVIRGLVGYEGAEVIKEFGPNYKFNPDVTFGNPKNPSQTLSNELALTDRDFKLPQTWRSNIAVDQKLPFGINATVEFIYGKDLSTPIIANIMQKDPDATLKGPDNRKYWKGDFAKIKDLSRGVYYLTNAENKGDYYSLTLQLDKNFDNGFSTMLAYTYNRTRTIGADGGSQASSSWPAVVVENRNNPELGFEGAPHRLIGRVGYTSGNTSISVFYEGRSSGRSSYTYRGRGFADNAQRLMFVPNKASDLKFEEYKSGGKTFTVAEQEKAFDEYINNDPYLSSKRGSVVDRGGLVGPWFNTFDLRLTHDIEIYKKNKLQLSLDILNIGNLLNSDWGVPQYLYSTNILSFVKTTPEGEPVYKMERNTGTNELISERFINSLSIRNAWSMQVGIRYMFN